MKVGRANVFSALLSWFACAEAWAPGSRLAARFGSNWSHQKIQGLSAKGGAEQDDEPRGIYARNKLLVKSDEDGKILWFVTFLISLWFFTVPTEIRRTHICSTQFALEHRLSDCVDIREWAKLVTNHYSTCSGPNCIQLDFSIDPKTLKSNGLI